ncbi:MAG TPA: TVP38/TMEM64 family protein [Polyangia bacterium]|nr:TVP38/TMEM64 family protein [Polyangia bacterium]
MTRARALRVAALLLAAAAAVAALLLLPTSRWLLALTSWIHGAGVMGALVYGLAYVVATVLALPGTILTLGAGFAYGPFYGTLLVSPASVVGATLAFVLGRSLARGWIERRLSRYPRFAAVDRAVGVDGFKIVLLLRLSPVFPFNFLNYALGLTRVTLRDYVVASAIGMLPGTVMYVYLGSLVTNAAELASGRRPQAGPWGQVLFWGGLLATVLVTVLLTRLTRQALDRALAQEGSP